MKKIFSIVLFLISAGNCFGQVTFQKTYGGTSGDFANCVQQTTDGGYITVGVIRYSGAPDYNVYLIKTDASGDILWTKIFGGINDDRGYFVQQTTDGGYIISGRTFSFGAGSYDAYLIKTDGSGNAIWTKTFGGTDDDEVYSVQQTADGGYVIAGYTKSFGAGDYDVYLVKTDVNGNSIWTKTYGEWLEDGAYFVCQTTDGGYIITGLTLSFGAGSYDVYLIRTDANGDSLWTKTFGGAGNDWGYSVQQTTDGGYIIAGETSSFSLGDPDVYLIKTDSNGNSLWTKTFGGSSGDLGYSVQQTTDGGYIITGTTFSFGGSNGDIYSIKTDSSGNSLWTKNYGGSGSDLGLFVNQTTDGGYIITGNTNSFGLGSADFYLIRTDSLGNSGCIQGTPATIVTTPSTQVTTPPTIVTSPSAIVTTPATIFGSGGTVTTLCTTVGISPTPTLPGGEGVAIAPNPATNNFTITFLNTINKGTVEIYNVMGKKFFTENISTVSQKEIHLKNMETGIYFVKVRSEEKEYCEKLVVQ